MNLSGSGSARYRVTPLNRLQRTRAQFPARVFRFKGKRGDGYILIAYRNDYFTVCKKSRLFVNANALTHTKTDDWYPVHRNLLSVFGQKLSGRSDGASWHQPWVAEGCSAEISIVFPAPCPGRYLRGSNDGRGLEGNVRGEGYVFTDYCSRTGLDWRG